MKRNPVRHILERSVVLIKLGIANVVTVFLYKFLMKAHFFLRVMPAGEVYHGKFFAEPLTDKEKQIDFNDKNFFIAQANELLKGNVPFFSDRSFYLGSPPDWFFNPIEGKRVEEISSHWSRLREFETGAGDIKCTWEASRFYWAVVYAKAYRLSGDRLYLNTLNEWVSSWVLKNPMNVGPNWKCGQETAIRMINLMLSSFVLGQDHDPSDGVRRFVKEHCQRIEATIYYAIAQNNNHGLIEAAALFVGGAWLKDHAGNDKKLLRTALKWERMGRFWLENRAQQLILADGSFSQYSVNYHRLVLDTLSLVKFWQEYLDLASFSDGFMKKAQAAVVWLFQMVDSISGDAPNMGHNDGSLLFHLSACDYRDFRPSVQLASMMFLKKKIFKHGPWDDVLTDLNLKEKEGKDDIFSKKNQFFSDGGYVNFVSERSWGVVRLPHYRFRPGHADALHFDLWYNGRNILRDSGTYSYNCDEPWQGYFLGTKSHNTVECDGRDQMPRLSRFLWGAWTQGKTIRPLAQQGKAWTWSGAYKDGRGCQHMREISVCEDVWKIRDSVSGFKREAVLRWRLEPVVWKLVGNVCHGQGIDITIKADSSHVKLRLSHGWESRHYMEKTSLPVLELSTKGHCCKMMTEIKFLGA